jgi:hypothetical protein
MPAPGFSTDTTTRPIASAAVDTTSKYTSARRPSDRRLLPPMCDAGDDRGEHDRRDQHFDQPDEAVPKRAHRGGAPGATGEHHAERDADEHLTQIRVEGRFRAAASDRVASVDMPGTSYRYAVYNCASPQSRLFPTATSRPQARRPRPGPVQPRASLRSGHWMTLNGGAIPAISAAPAPLPRLFDIDADMVAQCHWQPRQADRELVLLHGLNGSSEAHYMLGIAEKAFGAGLNVVRLNQRNCGGTEHLSVGLFHSGLTADVRHVIHELATIDRLSSIVVAGYSLGGNLALKLAGEFGNAPPPTLKAVAAVSPILEISPCVRALERPELAVQWNFVRDLKAASGAGPHLAGFTT